MSFQQGLSGLNASSKNLEIIGNNIANANTYGSKSSRAEFGDFYAAALSGAGTSAIGIGTTLQTVAQQFTQGSITTTENPLDLAISGRGFFQVSDGQSPTTYSRNGQFKIDREGFIVNNSSYKLLGYKADATGQIQPGLAVPLQLPTAGISPKQTSTISMELNLDSTKPVTLPTTAPPNIDFQNATTYNNATSLTVFDGKGQPVALTFYYQRATTFDDTAGTPDTWNVYVTANGKTLAGTDTAPDKMTTITFSRDGKTVTDPTAAIDLPIPASVNADGATTLAIPDPASPNAAAETIKLDLTKLTQFGAPFGVTDLRQNGYSAGQLVSIAVENNGIVTARYSNGQTKSAGQVEIATFRNMQGLQPIGNNMWARTFASGDPITGTPGEGNLGSLQSGSLEESNVDLTGELVNMITAQRIYQANAQTIKTQDQVLQTLVNLR
jgi:flagellar hook protein FlgE